MPDALNRYASRARDGATPQHADDHRYGAPENSYLAYIRGTGQAGKNVINDNGTLVDPPGPAPVAAAEKAREFLNDAIKRAKDPPFMLFYWTTQPHLPANAPPGYGDLFSDAKLPRLPSFNEANVSDKPSYIRGLPPLTQNQIDGLEADHKTQLRNLAHVDVR